MDCSAQPAPVLDKAAFTQHLTLPALRIPKQRCSELMKRFTGYTFDRPKTRCVVLDGSREDMRLLLLRETVGSPSSLTTPLRAVVEEGSIEWTHHELTLDYHHFSTEQVLKALLPAGMEIPTSFEAVGHIAHLNLREEALPYKAIIGQVILDKNPSIRTVVNKVGSIDNQFRVFQMEVIAGEDALETLVKQHAARFRLDFSKVYWNSRLEGEHTRLVRLFKRNEVVADIMAGIGPFAIPAAQAGCTVYANDLNPASAHYLKQNIQLNRMGPKVLPFNMDARDFVRLLCATPGGPVERLRQEQSGDGGSGSGGGAPAGGSKPAGGGRGGSAEGQASQPWPAGLVVPPGGILFQHAIMNLPASAVEFLDAFHGAFCPTAWRDRLPWVHCYTFSKGETEQEVIARMEAALGGKLDHLPHVHEVRDVAPNKLMLCVSFRVPAAVAFAGREEPAGEGQHPAAESAALDHQRPPPQQQQVAPATEEALNGSDTGTHAAKKQRTCETDDLL